MLLTDTDVHDLITEIWGSYMVSEIYPTEEAAAPGESLSAVIHIHGTWEGTVTLHVSVPLSQEIAATMFGLELDELSDADIADAVGEIANMLGGSVKSLVEGDSSLSLPTVIGGAQYTLQVPGATVLNKVWLTASDEPIAVAVLERQSADIAVPAAS